MIQEGTREGYHDFQAGLKKPKCTGARKEDGSKRLKQLKSCLRLRFDRYLVPLLEAIGLVFCPTQPNLFVGPETGGDYRIIVFAEKKVDDGPPQHPWAVCLVTKVVVLDSLEKLAGLAVGKALKGREEEGLEQLECSAIQKEIVGGLLDKKENTNGCEIQMHPKLTKSHCKSAESEEEEEKSPVGMKSGDEKLIDKSEGKVIEGEERKIAACKESIVLSSSEEDEGLRDSTGKESTDKGPQRRKTENEEKKMANSINKELISVM